MPAHVRASSSKLISSRLPTLATFAISVSSWWFRSRSCGDFSQTVLDSAIEVIPVGLSRAQFVPVTLPDLGGSLREFGLEARPYVLLVVIVLLREQSEGFFGTQLGYAGEVLDPEAIQNLSALQFPRTATQRALDGVVHFAVSTHVYVYG